MAKKSSAGSMRDQIIEKSLPLYVSKGIDGVSLADLARALKTSNAAILYHFEKPQDVFIALIDKWAEAGVKHTNTYLSGVLGERPEVVISAFMQATLILLDRDELFAKLTLAIFLGAQSNTNVRTKLDNILEGGRTRLFEILKRSGFSPAHAKREAVYLHSLIVGALVYEMLVQPHSLISKKEFRKVEQEKFREVVSEIFAGSRST